MTSEPSAPRRIRFSDALARIVAASFGSRSRIRRLASPRGISIADAREEGRLACEPPLKHGPDERGGLFEIFGEAKAQVRSPKLRDGLGFELAHPLAADADHLADLAEGARALIRDAE